MTVKEKILLLLATAIVMCAPINTSAQVTIGSAIAPNEFSVLELISNATGGFRLPQMTTVQRNAMASKFGTLAKSEALGLQIFNTTTYCVETWNGTKWISHCEGDAPLFPPDVMYPVLPLGRNNICLSGTTCFDIAQTSGGEGYGDLSNPVLRTPDFSVEARTYTLSGNVSDVKFYILNNDINYFDKLIKSIEQSGNNVTLTFEREVIRSMKEKSKTFTLLAQFKDNIDNQYRQTSLEITVQDRMCGVTLRSGTCSWIRFMPHNLGADQTLSIEEQTAFNSARHTNVLPSGTALNATVHGDLYQWGRRRDGHEKRNSQNHANNNTTAQGSQVANSVLDANGQVSSGNGVGRFIKQNSGNWDWRANQLNTLWNTNTEENPVKHVNNDPCPEGWRIPTNAEWAGVHANNDRRHIGTYSHSGTASGTPGLMYRLRTSGTGSVDNTMTAEQASIFLPAGGNRHTNNGALTEVGSMGAYWSSTPDGNRVFYLSFISSTVNPNTSSFRAYGFSTRCVAE